MGRVLVFGGAEKGRLFAPAEQTTSRQDGWVMVQLEDAGILKLLTQGAKAFADEDAVRRIIAQALRSGKYHHIVAGLLVEDGTKWTPAGAEQNAEYFADVTDPDEKKQIADTFEAMLLSFFQHGAPSLTPSTTVSETTADAPTPIKRGRRSTATRAAVGRTARGGSQTATATA